jgi:hypothetical protein
MNYISQVRNPEQIRNQCRLADFKLKNHQHILFSAKTYILSG